MSTTPRTGHPYHMYEAIRAQPEAWIRAVERNAPAVEAVARQLAAARAFYLLGIGTSFHAARVGEYLLDKYAAGLPVQAMHSFDFALYGPPLAANSAVVALSHRGTKRYSLASLRRAREAGCLTVLVRGQRDADTAQQSPEEIPTADVVLETVPQEKSAAHTISYTGGVAVLALLAAKIASHLAGGTKLPAELLNPQLPDALGAALATEQQMAELAKAHVKRRRIWITGGGPSAITAVETALKIKETSYLQAEGMAVETMLHGPFQCAEPDDLFILIAPAGAAQTRIIELAAMVNAIGAAYVVISDGTPESLRHGAAGWCVVPSVPEPFTALTCLVPLQLFSYHLALARGTNPDAFRLDDPRFASAFKTVEL